MNDIWNEICADLQVCIQRDVLEKEYENTIANCMRFLHWRKSEGEITTQYPIQVGHETKLADIVVSSDGIEQFVIEVKRPNHSISQEDRKQLLSYMRMLSHPVKCGIYIGENIRLFYDDLTSEPTEICTIDISQNDPNGAKFVELFHKDTYTPQAILDFYEDIKHKREEAQQKQEAINYLRNNINTDTIKEALKEKYIRDGYPEEVIGDVLSKIRIHITSTSPLSIIDVPQNSPQVNAKQIVSTNKKSTPPKFRLHGNILGEGKFALEFVKLFVQEHPMTYNEYEQIFNSLPTHIPNGMIRDWEEIKGTTKKFFRDEKDQLHSIDGKTFVVNHEWTKERIQPVVDFANEQGYNVELIQH